MRGRAAIVAVAAGAAIAGATGAASATQSSTESHNASDKSTNDELVASNIEPAANVTPINPAENGDSDLASSAAPSDMHTFTDQLKQGKKVAAAAKAADRAARAPEFVSPIPLGTYQFTSGFEFRWGAFHGGIDFAAPLGTPIHAVTDGVVREAGPASGYGNWVQVQAPDGTITMYGHMFNSGVNVHKGDRVKAGDVIAHVGTNGFSTGPHCHFEVWTKGMKIDPAPWLAAHGVKLSAYTG